MFQHAEIRNGIGSTESKWSGITQRTYFRNTVFGGRGCGGFALLGDLGLDREDGEGKFYCPSDSAGGDSRRAAGGFLILREGVLF